MSHVNESNTKLLLQCFELKLHLFAQFQIQCAERFIEQQHIRHLYQRTCHCHTLLLSTRKLFGFTTFHACQLHHFQSALDTTFNFILRRAFHFQTKGDILKNGHMLEEGITLKNSVHFPLERRRMSHGIPFNIHFAFRGPLKPCNHP